MSDDERDLLITSEDSQRGHSGSHSENSGTSHGGRHGRGSPSGAEHNRTHRRRSSIVNTLRSAGGSNSLDNFARSWQRAAGFYEITPVKQSYRLSDAGSGADQDEYVREHIGGPSSQRSLLRAALQAEGRHVSDSPFDEESGAAPRRPSVSNDVERRLSERRFERDGSLASVGPSSASPFGGSFGASYGSLSTRSNDAAMRHAGRLFAEQQGSSAAESDKEREPLLVKRVQEDGKVINVVVGQSTLPQTVFNSANVLIGIGLLSLPLALHYSGWVIGLAMLIFSAVSTNYTAKLLAKCLNVDNALITFGDLAYVAFGNRARIAVSIIFTLELLGACVALVVLFADTIEALIPGLGVTSWKLICGLILVPLAFLPLRLLSFTSILGILCCTGITIGIFIDGLLKPHQPGSLQEPAKTHLFPANWGTVPLSFGLIMAPWGGHSVFPNIYRDMRRPRKYNKSVNITYACSFILDIAIAVAGLLMFGDGILDEVTSNIFFTPGNPKFISAFMAICVAIVPLTKIPLNARPIISTIEVFLGLDRRALASSTHMVGTSGLNRGILKATVRILAQVVFVIVAIAVPSFERIMTLLGAIACFSICIIVPVAVHLKLFGETLRPAERWLNWGLLVVSFIMGGVSTVFALLPKEMIGAK